MGIHINAFWGRVLWFYLEGLIIEWLGLEGARYLVE